MPRFQQNYYIACRLQDKILNMVGVRPQNRERHDPKAEKALEPSQLATLAKAWDTLEERKRILRMKPLPKAQDVSVAREKARVRAIPRE